MSKRTFIIFAAVFSLSAVFSILALAQSPVMSPDLASNAMDSQGLRRYRVGPGDILDVRVFGQPELNSTVEIDEDGNISSLPFLEDPIPAKCRNEKDIQKTITEAYSKYLIKPRVSVRILERRSRQPAVIFGAVRAPTRVQMMRRVRLHELLALAGGITGGASGTIQIMHTEKELCPEPGDFPEQVAATVPTDPKATSAPTDPKATTVPTDPKATSAPTALKTTSAPTDPKATSAPTDPKATTVPTAPKTTSVPNGTSVSNAASAPNTTSPKDTSVQDPAESDRAAFAGIGELEVYKIDTLKAGGFSMTASGAGSNDPYIRPGDIVIVTEGLPVYVMGAVMAPREIVLKDQLTLARALAMAGGLQRLAKGNEINIYRHREGKLGQDHLKVDYDAIKKGTAQDILLQAYDIIDVRMQGSFTSGSLREILLGITKGSIGGIGGSLPYRVIP
jgi:protein involved in polysaccharide export with SLBB domain